MTPAASNGELPMKLIDLQQRLAKMDIQGVAVQALSLTARVACRPTRGLSSWPIPASGANERHREALLR